MNEGTLPKHLPRFYQQCVEASQHTGKRLRDWANRRTDSYLLTWTYLTGALGSLCAEIGVATDDWLHRKPPDAPDQVLNVEKPEAKNPLTGGKDKQ